MGGLGPGGNSVIEHHCLLSNQRGGAVVAPPDPLPMQQKYPPCPQRRRNPMPLISPIEAG